MSKLFVWSKTLQGAAVLILLNSVTWATKLQAAHWRLDATLSLELIALVFGSVLTVYGRWTAKENLRL